MAPKMDFRELAAATFNDDDANALVEMTQLTNGTNYSAANVRNAHMRRMMFNSRQMQWPFIK